MGFTDEEHPTAIVEQATNTGDESPNRRLSDAPNRPAARILGVPDQVRPIGSIRHQNGAMATNTRSPFRQLLVFVLVLIALNVVAQLLGLQIRISIIGSIVLTLIVGGVMAIANRRG